MKEAGPITSNAPKLGKNPVKIIGFDKNGGYVEDVWDVEACHGRVTVRMAAVTWVVSKLATSRDHKCQQGQDYRRN